MAHILFGSIWHTYGGFLMLGYQRHTYLQAVRSLGRTRTVDHRGMGRSEEESTRVRAKDLTRQSLLVKRKKAARYFAIFSSFSMCRIYYLSHSGPCCVLGHFQLSFHGQAFDDAWSFRSFSFKTSRRKTKWTKAPKSLKTIVPHWRTLVATSRASCLGRSR